MKHFFSIVVLTVWFLLASTAAKAQCSSFSYTIGQNNSVTFYGVSSPSNAATSFTWNFGAGNLAPYVATGTLGLQTTVTYSAPGVYTVNFASSSCTPAYTGVIIVPTCSVSISTANATGTLCSGSATVNYTGYCGTPTISWSNGGSTATQFSLCPGFYSVTVAGNNPTCCPVGTATASVGSITPCVLTASFTRTLLPNGVVNFSSTSTGTTASSVYVWEYGDGSANGSGLTSTHVYTTTGPFNSYLTVYNNSLTCYDTSNVISITPIFCSLTASINSTYLPAQNAYSFSCNAAGTTSTSTYFWNFGDGNSSSSASTVHAYSSPGVYTVSLFINNNSVPSCSLITVTTITVPCGVTAAFSHTVGTNGLVSFSNLSTGTNAGSYYSWDFGDGYGDVSPNTFHQYTNAGTHYITFQAFNSAFCKDSLVQAINITGLSCNANALFTVSAGGAPSQWIVTPAYPYNVSAASWNWGDGNTSNTLYASHIYSVAGNYSICLSVTVSCNASGTYCYSQYFNKPASGAGSGPVYINVVPPQLKLGISAYQNSEPGVIFWPNPAAAELNYVMDENMLGSNLILTDVSGRTIERMSVGAVSGSIPVENLQAGLYFITVEGNTGRITKQIILEKNK